MGRSAHTAPQGGAPRFAIWRPIRAGDIIYPNPSPPEWALSRPVPRRPRSTLENALAAARVLGAPFAFGSLDLWRDEASRQVRRLVGTDAVVFYLDPSCLPELPRGIAPPEPVRADQFSPDQLAGFLRHAIDDTGTRLALAHDAAAVSQAMIVGEDWDGFYADPAVNAFYLPNRFLDTAGLFVADPAGRKAASIEVLSGRAHDPRLADQGLQRLELLRPALLAGYAAVHAAGAAWRELTRLFDRLPGAMAVVAPDGRLVHRNQALLDLCDDGADPRALARVVEAHAQQHAEFMRALSSRNQESARDHLAAGDPSAFREVSVAGERYRLTLSPMPATLFGSRSAFLLQVERLRARVAADPLVAPLGLTRREEEVARLIAAGYGTREIACRLTLSSHTVRHHIEHVLRKLQVHSRVGVAAALRGERSPSGTPANHGGDSTRHR